MKLPPLNALKAFEAAARHGGFIAAADELCVTRGAVSRHVKTLEEHVGVPLFRRHARGVELTDAGRELLPVLSRAFGQIAEAADRLSGRSADLRIICPPATSIRWLIPRLEAFRAEHPEIRLRLTTDFHGGDGYVAADYDIGFSCEFWPGRHKEIENRTLFPTLLSPACAPATMEGDERLLQPEHLARFKLLHETANRADWTTWLEAFPAAGVTPASGDVFPNLDMATRAAVMGTGVVMCDLVLCREELERGLLCLPFPDRVCASPLGGISMIAHRDKWEDPKVKVFADWIHAAAEPDRERCAALLRCQIVE